MGKKLGLFLGLFAGAAAAHVAYRQLNDDQKARLTEAVEKQVANFKNRAVDYVFYANDAWVDFKEAFKEQSDEMSQRVKQVAGSWNGETAGKDQLRAELENVATKANDFSDDIVLSSVQTFGGADIATEGPNQQTVVFYPDGTVKPAE